MKVAQLFESESLLKTLIQQRLDKGEPVKLDFWHEGFTYTGYVRLIRGNTLYSVVQLPNGFTEQERFVLRPDADDHFTLRKLNGGWQVQKI